jgi:LysR substrate binding domain
MTIVPSEVFSAEIPGRVLAGKVDVGIALQPEAMRGVRSELLRVESLVLLVGKRHRLADATVVPLASLENETLLCSSSRGNWRPPTTTASSPPASRPASSPASQPSPTRRHKRCSPTYRPAARCASLLPHTACTPLRPSRA